MHLAAREAEPGGRDEITEARDALALDGLHQTLLRRAALQVVRRGDQHRCLGETAAVDLRRDGNRRAIDGNGLPADEEVELGAGVEDGIKVEVRARRRGEDHVHIRLVRVGRARNGRRREGVAVDRADVHPVRRLGNHRGGRSLGHDRAG